MIKRVTNSGLIVLTGERGIVDNRTGIVYSEFVGRPEMEKHFADVEPE